MSSNSPVRSQAGGQEQADLAATLARIEARLERLERVLEPVSELSGQLPAALATVTDVIDEKAARLGDAESRMHALGEVLERLSRPQTLASLGKLVDLAQNAPAVVATLTDIIDEVMDEAARDGLELDRVFDDTKRLAFGLLRVTTSAELRALLDSGMLDPSALRSLGQVAGALVDAGEQPATRVGMFGALRALGNDDVQRALGFLLQVASGFGRSLGTERQSETKRLTQGAQGR